VTAEQKNDLLEVLRFMQDEPYDPYSHQEHATRITALFVAAIKLLESVEPKE
jgi:hypothetical protein